MEVQCWAVSQCGNYRQITNYTTRIKQLVFCFTGLLHFSSKTLHNLLIVCVIHANLICYEKMVNCSFSLFKLDTYKCETSSIIKSNPACLPMSVLCFNIISFFSFYSQPNQKLFRNLYCMVDKYPMNRFCLFVFPVIVVLL